MRILDKLNIQFVMSAKSVLASRINAIYPLSLFSISKNNPDYGEVIVITKVESASAYDFLSAPCSAGQAVGKD